MAVATITLESTNGDSVVVSGPGDDWFDDEIILDTDPQGLYDMGFTVRTVSGAFERGGRAIGETVPIREPVLPFHLTKESRKRFQKLWGTPGRFQKVRMHIDDEESGRRTLTLRLAKEIVYTTDGGFDADIDDEIHAVASTLALNPMFEGPEDVAQWTNPGNRFLVNLKADGGAWLATFGGETTSGMPGIPWNVTASQLRTRLEELSTVGAGHVTVTGTAATTSTAGNFVVEFSGVTGTLTVNRGNLTAGGFWGDIGLVHGEVTATGQCFGWFELWNPTDQDLWAEWTFDPATQWQFPDWAFDQERRWGRAVGQDAARMIVTKPVVSLLSVMSDPFMDTYVCADLSNFAGLMNGVEPIYPVPPYTGTEDSPILVPVVCNGPPGAKATLRQRRFWSAESGLEA